VLAIVCKIMNWQAPRIDDYVPPVVHGMRRTNPKERARKRTLTDDEIRAVWKMAEGNGAFGALIRLLLLTAQRRSKVLALRWRDVSADGVWTIPTEAREKGNAGELALPQLALDIIREQPQFDGNPFVLAGRGGGHIRGISEAKLAFCRKLPDMAQWQLHDLRRTSRSLLSRAGVLSEHAEKVMGHSVGGVEAVYDRFRYSDQKADALKRLAALIDAIVHPQPAAVLPLESKRTRR
jgi:integrase